MIVERMKQLTDELNANLKPAQHTAAEAQLIQAMKEPNGLARNAAALAEGEPNDGDRAEMSRWQLARDLDSLTKDVNGLVDNASVATDGYLVYRRPDAAGGGFLVWEGNKTRAAEVATGREAAKLALG